LDDTKKIAWGLLLEKAWAKIKGNYDDAEGGFTLTGMRSLIGSPVFPYKATAYTTEAKISELF